MILPLPSVPLPAGHKSGTNAIIAIMLAMVLLIAGTFIYVAEQEDALRASRLETREVRLAGLALIEAEGAVLHALADGGSAAVGRYQLAIAKFDTHQSAQFPPKVRVRGRDLTGRTAVLQVRRNWQTIMQRAAAGDFAGARALNEAQGMPQLTQATIAAMLTWIATLDAAGDATQQRIDLTIKAVIALQLVSGLFCIIVYLIAARRGAAEAAARAQAVTDATRSREKVLKLFEMTDMLQSAQDQNDANSVLRATAIELLPQFAGALYVFSNSRDRLVLSVSWNLDNGSAPADTIALNQCWAMKRGKTHLNHPGCEKLCCAHHPGDGYVLEIPMAARGEVLGLLCLQSNAADGEAQLRAISDLGAALADAMSLALANLALGAKLRSQALRDPLTGLYNRRYMEDTPQRVTQHAQRERQSVSVIMIDLDHFKRLNDQHGHAKGDTVLRDAAGVITNQLRESDVACRYGGEEMLVVLPNCGRDMAVHKAERLRVAIAALSQPGIDVSASFGVATIPSTSSTMRDLMHAADTALYAAKEQGRNRVVAAPTLDPGPRTLVAAAE
jgi:diguanylate cyclase (GGDEF)-like protein